ncbi:MAG: hypothetical protein BA873_03030 [Desulfobulbaceae bacterium C00003063]|nr:MAG: hypothetical protein BA873_03030 [Desulfobulbaceae bacterium C00003063]
MSYILDALKKSDRERHEGEVPGLDAIHDRYPYSSEHPSNSHWIKYFFTAFAAFLLISIFSAAWYLKNNSSDPVETASLNKKQFTNTATEKTEAATPLESKKNTIQAEHSQPPVLLTNVKKKVLIPYQKESSPEAETTVISLPKEPAEIPEFADLPPSLQQAIPELHFAGHTYAEDPSSRMIIINNNILREGEKVNNSLSLVEITWAGVILDYKGQQFEMETD